MNSTPARHPHGCLTLISSFIKRKQSLVTLQSFCRSCRMCPHYYAFRQRFLSLCWGAPSSMSCLLVLQRHGAVLPLLCSSPSGWDRPEHLLGPQQPFGGHLQVSFANFVRLLVLWLDVFLLADGLVLLFLSIRAYFPGQSMWRFPHNVSEVLFPAPAISNNYHKHRRASFL